MEPLELFLAKAQENVFNETHRATMARNIGNYDAKVAQGKQQYANLELARMRASGLRHKAIEHLDKYLIEFEANFIRKGGKVIWAQDAEEANREIANILKKNKISHVVKSKSMATEEIALNEFLKKEGIESLETDLGEYIQQLEGEPAYHIVTPAMHKSKEDVAKLFNKKHGISEESSPQEITAWTRKYMKEKFRKAGAGITGANFLAADSGSVCVTENEGNALMSVAFPKIHIVVAGIDKLIPSFKDLDLFFSLLSTYGTGQNISAYNSIFTAPKQKGEKDGPEEMYVVLLDNGRSSVLEKTEQRRALECIRCGACLNACPVYANVGGHAYGSVISGPIGSVMMQNTGAPAGKFDHLSFASTLCGKCSESCPVKIDLHKLLLYNRRDTMEKGYATKTENVMWFFWKSAMLRRSKMDKGGSKLKNFMLRQFFRKSWGDKRIFPSVAAKSFNQVWRERKGIK
ncbi:MAG TPA: lactate utilization protein B [Bacteroidia bacterium]|jgi:L-lactate dehydrogenase complex protein LldF|nr:lactate utilization protein B [Bacteroidia bacterium]